jgi:hypothetical protein
VRHTSINPASQSSHGRPAPVSRLIPRALANDGYPPACVAKNSLFHMMRSV